MIAIILIVARVAGEWVEISQNHYRKPLRTIYNIHNIDKVTESYIQESTNPNKIYSNFSLTQQSQHTWNKGSVNKVPKVGNVQRVQLQSNSIKAPSLPKDAVDISNQYPLRPNKDHNIKTPDGTALMLNGKGYQIRGNDNFNSDEETTSNQDLFDMQMEIPNVTKNASNYHIKNSDTSTHNKHKLAIHTNSEPSSEEDIVQQKKFNNRIYTRPETTSITNIFSYQKDKSDNQNVESVLDKPIIDSSKYEEFVTNKRRPTANTTVNADTNPKANNFKAFDKDEDGKVEDVEEEIVPVKNHKANTLQSIMKIMKLVADTIQTNTHRSVYSKTKYLHNLKDTILATIESQQLMQSSTTVHGTRLTIQILKDLGHILPRGRSKDWRRQDQIEAAWPDDAPAPRRRRAARGHLQIPSSESALMSISFLTFAVFLIKLVLQLIHLYKNKTMMITPAVVATVGRRVAKATGHAKLKAN